MTFELGCHVLDLVIGVLGKPARVTPFIQHSSKLDDSLSDNMLATASVKSSAIEVEGSARWPLVVCGTEDTFKIQPLDNPSARVSLPQPRGKYKKGVQEVTFSKYTRYRVSPAPHRRAIIARS